LKHLKRAYLALMIVFMYAPIIVLMVFSFNRSKSRANWGGFTLGWYSELFKDPKILSALYTTLSVAVLSALIAAVLGTAAAVGIDSMKSRGRRIMMTVTNIPVVNPDIVMGVSLMLLYIFLFNAFSFLRLQLGYATLLLAHVSFNVPYVILSVLPKLRRMDDHLFEAALDLGAPPFKSFYKVILPEIMPGVVTGAMLAFTMSVDDFVVSFFTTGAGVENLSVLIYSMARRGINPKINALSTLMFAFVLILLYLINRSDTSKQRKGERELNEADY